MAEKKLTGDPRIDHGWFSRRHQTGEAHADARRAREEKRTARFRSAKERQEAAAQREPQEQLRRLDERLGVGVGAKKERARLTRINA